MAVVGIIIFFGGLAEREKIFKSVYLTRNLKPEMLIDAIIGKAGSGESPSRVFSARDETGCMGQREGGGTISFFAERGIGPCLPWNSLNTAAMLPAGSSERIGLQDFVSAAGANGLRQSLAAISSPWNSLIAWRNGQDFTALETSEAALLGHMAILLKARFWANQREICRCVPYLYRLMRIFIYT